MNSAKSRKVHGLVLSGQPEVLNSREESRSAGHKVYLGSECLRGHGGLRYVSNGVCVSCTRARGADAMMTVNEKSKLKEVSRRIEIDHKRDEWHDDYYDFDFE